VSAYCSRVSEIRIARDVTDADVLRALEVYNAVHAPHRESLAGARETERRARDFVGFSALVDGRVVGGAHVSIPSYSDLPGADVYVLPDWRRHGIGDRLFREVSSWAAERGATELRASVTEGKEESLAFARHRGFEEVSRDLLVRLDLTTIETPEVDPPEGIEIVTLADNPELARGLYEVACEAWPDVPSDEPLTMEPFDAWVRFALEGADVNPRAVFAAVADGEVVGYAKLTFSEAQPEQAEHDLTGVKRAWRGRGIARTLKQAQIAWAKREGFERLQTVNAVDNAPIRRLNDEFGYASIPGRIRLRGPVAASQHHGKGSDPKV
jgi:mycothiol synthase